MYIRVAITATLLVFTQAIAEARTNKPDYEIFANYTATPDTVQLDVCGVVGNNIGCFGDPLLSPPFEQACAVLEGRPKYKGDVVTRAIYILDKRTAKGDPPILYVYTRSDTITENNDTVQVTLTAQIPLDLVGGSRTHCMMAGNDRFVYTATNASSQVMMTDKAVLDAGPFVVGGPVTGLTADERGFVAIDFQGGYVITNSGGSPVYTGSDNVYEASTRNAWLPKLP